MFLEQTDGGAVNHLGPFPGFIPKDYRLFHVLGAPRFEQYVEARWELEPLASHKGMPKERSPQAIELAGPRYRDDETSWRWIELDKFLAYPWQRTVRVAGAFGPIGLTEIETTGDTKRWAEVHTARQMRFREITRDEMKAMVTENPALLDDPHEGVGKVFTVIDRDRSLAQMFTLDPLLAWLQRFEADAASIRVLLSIGI